MDNKPKTTQRHKGGMAALSAAEQTRIARKGGMAISRNRKHMAAIGRLGGLNSHAARKKTARAAARAAKAA